MEYKEVLQRLEPFMENLNRDFLQESLHKLEALENPTPIQRAALGLTYHEVCVVYYLRGKDKAYAQYAQKSYDSLIKSKETLPTSAYPIIDAYIVSARSLIASTKSNLIELIRVIKDYDKLIIRDGDVCYCATFLQGSLLENLPNIFKVHKKAAQRFREIIDKQKVNADYTGDKILSFCYLSLSRFEKNSVKKQKLLDQSLLLDTDGTIASMSVRLNSK
jgi:hypothetical protein